VRIELMVAGGASYRAVAAKFGGASSYSVRRHWLTHITEERKASLVLGPVTRAALAARVSEESENVLDGFKASLAGLWQLYDTAIAAGDRNGGALLSGRIHENLNSVARLTGQLASSPLVQHNTVINNLGDSAEFVELQTRILRVLERHPQALREVIAELERANAQPPPALEHRRLAQEKAV
jgi:hypothetical protein